MNVMSQTSVSGAAPKKFFDQRELLGALLKGWWLIGLGAVIGILYGVNYLRAAPWVYQAQMQVTPAQQGGGGGAQNAVAGLASMAGIALPTVQGGSDFRLYLDSLMSREVADELSKNQAIMNKIYGGWNPATQTWAEPGPPDGTAGLIKSIKDFLGMPSQRWHPPDGESLMQFLGFNLQVQQDPRRPYIVKVVFFSTDRQFAVDLLRALHDVADNDLRQRALRRTADNIAYLSATLGRVTIAEHRLAITNALSEQEKAAMMARSGSPFAADLFEQPWAGTLPVAPNGRRELMTRAMLGGFCGALLALILWAARKYFGARWPRLRGRYADFSDPSARPGLSSSGE